MAGEDLRLREMSGLLFGVPVTAQGTAQLVSDPPLDLSLSVDGMQLPEIQTLLALRVAAADGQAQVGLRVEAKVVGRPLQPGSAGPRLAPKITLACLPWHDVVAKFTWTQGRLRVTGVHTHGSPRQLEGDVDVRLGPGPRKPRPPW